MAVILRQNVVQGKMEGAPAGADGREKTWSECHSFFELCNRGMDVGVWIALRLLYLSLLWDRDFRRIWIRNGIANGGITLLQN